jgi:hypothetical protein
METHHLHIDITDVNLLGKNINTINNTQAPLDASKEVAV